MAIRILLFLFCCGLMANEPVPATMATRRVVSAKSFSEQRAKALKTIAKKKRWNKNRRGSKSEWGAVKVRPKG